MVEAELLSPEQAAAAREAARRERLPLSRVLVRDGLVLARELATLLALHLGMAMVDLRSQSIDPQAVALVDEEVARKNLVLALKLDENRLTVAMSDPTDLQLIHDLTVLSGNAIEPVVATPEDILEHVEVSYRLTDNLREGLQDEVGGAYRGVTAGLLGEAHPAEIIDLLLRQAIQDRASDIHIEPHESSLGVRFRIDGILHEVGGLAPEMHPPLISRIKIMSGMNIAERRRSQDGQFTAEVQDRKVDVRVSVSNTVDGEIAVLRVLDKGFTLMGLSQLGMNPGDLERYRRLLRLPYGLVIVCGPTGAGKSTTLYASLLQMDRTENKAISLEDPVEYRINGVSQMRVNAEAGITFASQLRSILRLDPDVIMVGEIRDKETAVIAIQAALTGHLVISSLHANDAVSALLRLQDLGVPPYLISSSLAGVVAQRMVRVVCNGCRTLVSRPKAEQREFASELGEERDRYLYGSGCNMCARTGYMGRTGVFEVMPMSDDLRQLFLEDTPRHRLWEAASEEGMTSMRRDGMLKVKEGITTPYEVMRVLFSLEE